MVKCFSTIFICIFLLLPAYAQNISSSGDFFCATNKSKPKCVDGRKARCKKGYKPTCLPGGNIAKPDCCKEIEDVHVIDENVGFYCDEELLKCKNKAPIAQPGNSNKPFCLNNEIKCDSGSPSCDGGFGIPVCRLIQGRFIVVPGCLSLNGFYANSAACK